MFTQNSTANNQHGQHVTMKSERKRCHLQISYPINVNAAQVEHAANHAFRNIVAITSWWQYLTPRFTIVNLQIHRNTGYQHKSLFFLRKALLLHSYECTYMYVLLFRSFMTLPQTISLILVTMGEGFYP